MMRFTAVLLCVVSTSLMARAQSSSFPGLKPVFADDFSTDTRSEYKIAGDVSWEKGALTLSKGASIEREVDGGSWANVELQLEPVEMRDGSPPMELRIWFNLDGATNCYVRLLRKQEARTAVSSIALVDTAEQDGELVGHLVREIMLGDQACGELSVEYRNGLVRVGLAGNKVFAAHIENGDAAVLSVTSEVLESNAKLGGIVANATQREDRAFTKAESQQLAMSDSDNEELYTLYQQGKFAEAAKIGERIVRIKKAVLGEQHPDYAISLNNLAAMIERTGDLNRAEPLYVQALEIQKSVLGEHHPGYAVSLNNLAALLEKMGEYTRVEPLHQQAIEIIGSVQGDQHPSYAISLNNLATLYWKTGDYTRAAPLYEKSRDILGAVLGEQHPSYAAILNGLARTYDRMGDFARAERIYKQSCEIRRSVLGERHPDYAQSLNNLGILYEAMGDYARAELLYMQSRDIRQAVLGDRHPDYASSLNNLANLYHRMGDYSRAEPLCKRTIAIHKSVYGEEHPELAKSLNNLAALYSSMGDDVRAKSLYEKSLDIRKSVLGKQHPDYAESLNNLAGAYTALGDFHRAEPLLKQAYEIWRSALGESHPDTAACLNNLAGLYMETGEFVRAKAFFEQAIRIRKEVLGDQHPEYATSLSGLAFLYESMGDDTRAATNSIQAHKILVAAAIQSLPGLSEAQARSWMLENSPETDTVLSILRRSGKLQSPQAYSSLWQTKLMVSRLRVGRELPPDSTAEARDVFGRLRDARVQLANLVSATPEPEQAEDFRQSLAAASEKKEELEKELAKLNAASKRELAIRDATIGDLLKQLPQGVAVVDFARMDDWRFVDEQIELTSEDGRSEVRTVKKPDWTPVYDVFVLRRDRPAAVDTPAHWISLGPAEPIDQAITNWRRRFSPDAPLNDPSQQPQATDPARVLRELIWDKLEMHLDGIHTVVIIPDGALHRLPWSALPGRDPDQFLIHDYALTTAASGQQLFGILTETPIEAEPHFLVAGGIQYDKRPMPSPVRGKAKLLAMPSRTLDVSEEDRNWGYLQGAAKEANLVADLWPNRGGVTRLKSMQADERTLAQLLPQSRFAHLATHGFFDTKGEVYRVNLRKQSLYRSSIASSQKGASVAHRNPLLMTGIVMAGANVPPEKDEHGLPIGDDGILTAEEILGLDLRNTELVTLSACETGLGDVAAGQGVFGLQRALHQSGVRSVVASLWKVDDKATLELMKQFYTNLWIKDESKIHALRNAQLYLLDNPVLPDGTKLRGKVRERKQPTGATGDRQRRTDPRFWAAFQLSGDWR